MEQDTAMQNGYESDYPEPTPFQRTPYPGIGYQSQAGSPTGATSSSFPPSPTPLGGTNAFTSLANYFGFENGGNRPAQLAPPIGDQDAEDHAGVEQETEGRNLLTQAISRYTGIDHASNSLPGYHSLPDYDALENRDGERQPTASPVETAQPRGRGRGRPRGSGSGRGRRSWKWALKGTEHADIFKKPKIQPDPTIRKRGRDARTRGVRARGGRGAGPVDPGSDFKACMAQAMKAFLEEDLDGVVEHAKQALQANREMFQPHMLIYQVLQKRGRARESLVSLSMASILQREPEIWKTLARGYIALQDRTDDDVRVAVYCYSAALMLDTNDWEARTEKFRLYCDLKDWNKARKESKNMVRTRPEDLETLREYAGLCVETYDPSEWQRAVEAYKVAFQHFGDQDTFGDADDQWDHLNMYLDLLAKLDRYQEGVYELKRLARWFLSRKEDDWVWNEHTEDDREFDNDVERRGWVWQYAQGRITRDSLVYGLGIPMEIRVKLGLFRLRMGYDHYEEAFRHLEYLRKAFDYVEDYYDLFFEVAEALRSYKLWAAAVNFYEPVKSLSEVANEQFWMGLAMCYRELGRNDEAEQSYQTVIGINDDNLDARVRLVKLYESQGLREKQLAMATVVITKGRQGVLHKENGVPVNSGQQSRIQKMMRREVKRQERPLLPLLPKGSATTFRVDLHGKQPQPRVDVRHESVEEATMSSDDSDEDGPGEADRPGKPGRLSRKGVEQKLRKLQKQRVRIRPHYDLVRELWPLMASGKDQEAINDWIYHANAMAKEFKGTAAFYPIRSRDVTFIGLRTEIPANERGMIREMESMKKQLQAVGVSDDKPSSAQTQSESMPDDFHDISFPEWHRIISELTLLRAKHVEQAKCYYLLQEVLMPANVFLADAELKNASFALAICCAVMFNDSYLLVNTARQYVALGQKRSGMANQLVSASGRLTYGPTHLHETKAQRWIRIILRQEDTPGLSAGADAGLNTLYAHSIDNKKLGRMDQPLPYLFHALSLQPENLVVNLSIANSYIGNAMHKLTENRQYGIAQGLAFFYRYYDLRIKSGKAGHLQEAEYNLARMWHQIGLTHLAMPSYEKVLKLSGDVQREEARNGSENLEGISDFAQEAAFALQSIYVAAGNDQAAAAVAEEWLVL